MIVSNRGFMVLLFEETGLWIIVGVKNEKILLSNNKQM